MNLTRVLLMVAELPDIAGSELVREVLEAAAGLDLIEQSGVLKALKDKTSIGITVLYKQLREIQKKRKESERPAPSLTDPFDDLRLLETGSDREVARIVLARAQRGPEALVHCEDRFWRCSGGAWSETSDEELARAALELDGEACRDGFWKANANRVSGAVRVARDICADPEHFAAAPRGVAAGSTFVRFSPAGEVVTETLAPSHRVRARLPFDYDAAASCTRWLQYLGEVFRDDADAPEKIGLLQEFVGACVAGAATRFQTCLVIVGDGDNGKSVFLEVVQALFPTGSIASVAPQRLGSEYYVARLAGVLLNVVAEAPRADVEDSEDFKAIVAGDTVTGRHPAGRPFNFNALAGHLFACNSLFGTSDQSRGFWKRFTPVSFNRQFTDDEKDRDLAKRIKADELPGILAWAIEGARRALARGSYALPKSTIDTQNAWRRDVDQVLRFACECLEHVPEEKMGEGVLGKELYRTYTTWAEDNGLTRTMLSNQQFVSRLRKLPDLNYSSKHARDGERWNCRPIIHGKIIPFNRS